MKRFLSTDLSFSPAASLLLNHADAWICTLGIAIAALLLHQAINPRHLLLAVAVAAGYGLAFALNDYFDAPIDALDPAKAERNFFVGRARHAWPVVLLFWGGPALLAPVFAAYGFRGLVVAAVSAFVMWSYSAPPLRFKTRPGFDLLIHAGFVQTFPYVAIVYLTGSTWTDLDTTLVILLILASAMAQLEQQIRDARFDGLFEQTLTTRIGVERALKLLKGGTAGLMLWGVYKIIDGTIPLPVGVLGLLTLPAVLTRLWRKPHEPRPERLIQFLLFIAVLYLLGLVSWTAVNGTVAGVG